MCRQHLAWSLSHSVLSARLQYSLLWRFTGFPAASTLASIIARNCFAVFFPCNKASERMMRLTRRWL